VIALFLVTCRRGVEAIGKIAGQRSQPYENPRVDTSTEFCSMALLVDDLEIVRDCRLGNGIRRYCCR
jgi:hypothetical protein